MHITKWRVNLERIQNCMVPTIRHSGKGKLWRQQKYQWLLGWGREEKMDGWMEHRFLGQWKHCAWYVIMKVKLLSRVWLLATLWTVAYQTSPSMGFSRQECWSGLPLPSPEDLPNPGIETGSLALQADALQPEPPGKHLSKATESMTPWTNPKVNYGLRRTNVLIQFHQL